MDDFLKTYLEKIGRTPLLTPEEEKELAIQIENGEDDARKKFIEANLRLVVKIAKQYHEKYKWCGIDWWDTIQDGNFGLMKAVGKFDYRKGNRFSTYAVHWINQSIRAAIQSQTNALYVPRYKSQELGKFSKISQQLYEKLNRDPTLEEIADKMQMPIDKVSELMLIKLSQETKSLDEPISEGDNSRGDLIPDENITPHDEAVATIANELLIKQLKTLTEREERIILLRMGLQGERMLTLEEIGKMLGLTHVRVRQYEAIALRKLSDPSRRKHLISPAD